MNQTQTDICEECQKLQKEIGVTEQEITHKLDRKLTKTGKFILTLFGVSFTALTAITIPFLLPALRRICLPYVPATDKQVQNVISLLRRNDHSRLIDLGSGDGRIVIEAAKLGIRSFGVELNPWLVLYSRFNAWKSGVSHHTTFHTQDLWQMCELEKKLQRELCATGCVIACRFPFPSWSPHRSVGTGLDTVWVYSRKNSLK